MEDGLTIQQVAQATGLSEHTLRYYERAGLLPPVERHSGGHRRYVPRHLEALDFITKMRSTGMGIAALRVYMGLAFEGDATASARREMILRHREVVVGCIDEMEACLRIIDYKIAIYDKLTAESVGLATATTGRES